MGHNRSVEEQARRQQELETTLGMTMDIMEKEIKELKEKMAQTTDPDDANVTTAATAVASDTAGCDCSDSPTANFWVAGAAVALIMILCSVLVFLCVRQKTTPQVEQMTVVQPQQKLHAFLDRHQHTLIKLTHHDHAVRVAAVSRVHSVAHVKKTLKKKDVAGLRLQQRLKMRTQLKMTGAVVQVDVVDAKETQDREQKKKRKMERRLQRKAEKKAKKKRNKMNNQRTDGLESGTTPSLQ